MLYKTHLLSVLKPRKKRRIGSESGEGQALEVNCEVGHDNHKRTGKCGSSFRKVQVKRVVKHHESTVKSGDKRSELRS